MRHIARLLAVLALFFAFPAMAQEKPKEEEKTKCTKEYVVELEDALRDHDAGKDGFIKQVRGWCGKAKLVEDLASEGLEKIDVIGIRNMWDKTLGKVVSVRITSNTCKNMRKFLEERMSPVEKGKLLKSEIDRCTVELKR